MLSSNGHKLEFDSERAEIYGSQIKQMIRAVQEHVVYNFELYYTVYVYSGHSTVTEQIKERVKKLNAFGNNFPSFAIDLFFNMTTNNQNIAVRTEIREKQQNKVREQQKRNKENLLAEDVIPDWKTDKEKYKVWFKKECRKDYFEWTDELVCEFALISTRGSYGEYRGCKTREDKLQKFIELKIIDAMYEDGCNV